MNTKIKIGLTISLCLLILFVGCNSVEETGVQPTNIEETVDHNNEEAIECTVLDVREMTNRLESCIDYTIVLVLEDNYSKRYFFEYDKYKSTLNGTYSEEADVYNNLRVLVPGDKIKFYRNFTYELLKEQEEK